VIREAASGHSIAPVLWMKPNYGEANAVCQACQSAANQKSFGEESSAAKTGFQGRGSVPGGLF